MEGETKAKQESVESHEKKNTKAMKQALPRFLSGLMPHEPDPNCNRIDDDAPFPSLTPCVLLSSTTVSVMSWI